MANGSTRITVAKPEIVKHVFSNLVRQNRRQPFLYRFHVHALAAGVINHLVFTDFTGAKVARLRVGEIVTGHAGSRIHGKIFGQANPGFRADLQQVEQNLLFGVVRAGGVAGRRADADIFFPNDFFVAQVLFRGVAQEFFALSIRENPESFRVFQLIFFLHPNLT